LSRFIAGGIGAVLLLGVIVTAMAEPPERLRRNRGGLEGAVAIGSTIMNRNRAIVIIANGRGQAGSIASGSSVGNGGFWITTSNAYIFAAGPTLAGVVGADTVAFIGGPFSQVEPGSPVFSDLANQGGAGILWDTSDPDDIPNFPDQCTVDSVRQELFPTLASFAGEPFPGFSDQTVCLAVNDVLGPICADCSNRRMGVEIVETWFTFSVPAVQDFVFVAFRIFNRSEFINAANAPAQQAGPYTIEDLSVSIAIDPDVGVSGDDQISFLPEVQTMIYWDSDFAEPEFIGIPGIGAVTYLLTPTDPATGEEVGLSQFSVFVRGTVRPDPNSPEEWYEVLTGDPTATLFETAPDDIRGQASSGLFDLPAGEFVEVYGAFFFAPAAGVPPAELLAERPCNVTVLGQLCTDPDLLIPDANQHPVLDNIKAVQPTAQAVFDAGFVVPTAPPKPTATLAPGDGQVTIVWDNPAVTAVNPFAKVARDPFKRLGDGSPDPAAPGRGIFLNATDIIFDGSRDVGGTTGFVEASVAGLTGAEVTSPAFNLDFLIQDFSGFRIYRTITGSTDDAVLIAQFDEADFFVDGSFCTALEEVFSGGEFVRAVCTNIEAFNLGNDAGLSFAVIDRGGSFPNPSLGPGLINGIPVFYSVTAFSVNPGQSPVGDISDDAFNSVVPSPAPLSLESGLTPLVQAIPRSNASSFFDAVIGATSLQDGSGAVLPVPSGPMPLDATGAALAGPIPSAQDFDVRVAIVQPGVIPAEFEAVIHIDDVPYSSSFNTGFCGGAVNAPGCGDMPAGTFEEFPVGDGRGVAMELRVTDDSGNVLQTPLGPAQNLRAAFGSLAFGSDNGPVDGPVVEVLAPEDPSLGVAFTLQFVLGGVAARSHNCALRNVCELLTADGSGLPASVNAFNFSRLAYGSTAQSDVEVTWSNQGGVLGFSSVRNISDNADWAFSPNVITRRWGFARPTSLRAAEDAVATAAGTPRTADGKVLIPEPYCSEIRGPAALRCDVWGVDGLFTQGAPIWEDLTFNPNIFDELGATGGAYLTDPALMQPDALQETAALYTRAGLQGTRFAIAGHWLTVEFNQLPADGETWLLRFPVQNATGDGLDPDVVRPPTPGMSVSVSLQGGTNLAANADLSQISVVPNPFIAADEIQRGIGQQRILFTNLPPRATIRIYTISGNLLRVLNHSDESGTEPWDVRTRFDLIVASGNYYYHVTTPDGRTKLGRFSVIN
jgi:hypothetical protein